MASRRKAQALKQMNDAPAVIDEDSWARISRQPTWRDLELDDPKRDWNTFPSIKIASEGARE